jgi:DNA recombination protein RmuC
VAAPRRRAFPELSEGGGRLRDMDLLATAPVLALALGVVLGVGLGWLLGRGRASGLQAALAAEQRLSGERLEGAQLVGPLRDQLGRLEEQLRRLELARVRADAELREQVAQLSDGSERLGRETAALSAALRKPQTRGRWGELQLRRVVEHAGMLERCDFTEQPSLVLDDGSVQRPDLVVHLPGGGAVVVDAKVSLSAFLEAVELDDDEARGRRLDAHARHLRAHVDRLAEKAYWAQFPSAPEFVVLFVPGEAMLAPALERDPTLLEHAMSRRVHVATPTTLLSLLRAVAHAQAQTRLAEDARAVHAAGAELYGRLATFGSHVDRLGRSLTRTVSEYNAALGSLERSVLPSARRLADLGLEAEPLQVQGEITDAPRPVTAPELAGVTALPERPGLVERSG